MSTAKRDRIQAYLDPELAELVRKRAQDSDRSASREVTRLVRLALQAESSSADSDDED